MIRWFRRRLVARRPEPATVPLLPAMDYRYAAWWGYTPAEWAALPAMVRAHKREMVAHAVHGDFGKVKP